VDAPEWFTSALATESSSHSLEVQGTTIRYRVWGEGDLPTVVLVHGGAAHSHWWDHVAPALSAGRRVIALDLSGHGDSDHRDEYSIDHWATEVLAVAAAAATPDPILIGHSLGGIVTLAAALRAGSTLGGAVIVDSPLGDSSPEDDAAADNQAFGPHRVYADRATVVARFRPVPQQPTLPWVTAHIADTSITEMVGGWAWKFDPAVFVRFPVLPELRRLDCRAAFFYGQTGMVSPAMAAVITAGLGPDVPLIELPASGHHVMLDEPLAFIAGLRTLLAEWDLPA
jgi:pimeloyl-ACP methyl ester carboxylesterase